MDLNSVHRLCDLMDVRRIRIDIALMNAGLMPPRARKSAQGYEMMFAVHFLSPRVMIDPWLQDGVICPSNQLGETPRIVFVASKSHHSSLFIPSFYYQMTPKISLNARCSISISKNLSINGRTRSSRPVGPNGPNVHIWTS